MTGGVWDSDVIIDNHALYYARVATVDDGVHCSELTVLFVCTILIIAIFMTLICCQD